MNDIEDVIDAEFETVTPNGKKNNSSTSQRADVSAPSMDVDEDQLTVFGKKSNSSKGKASSLPLFTLVASICAVAAFYLAGGHVFFSPAKPTISSTNTEQTLMFENIINEVMTRSDGKVISVQATIFNSDKIAHVIPAIIVHLGDDPATWRKFRIDRGETLNPGERLVFTNTMRIGDGAYIEPKLSFSE